MKDGFIKVSACTPEVTVADPGKNAEEIIKTIREAAEQGSKVIVLPELCVTAYSCGDLFLHRALTDAAEAAVERIAKETAFSDALIFIGTPVRHGAGLYNCAAAIHRGKLLALVTKENLPEYSEFYEKRHFLPGMSEPVCVSFAGFQVPMGRDIIFSASNISELKVGCEICEDLWVPDSPGVRQALDGATILVNLSASDELVSKRAFLRNLTCVSSAKLVAGYVYAGAGAGESTQDVLFSGYRLIAENGALLSEAGRERKGIISSEIDVKRLLYERQKMNTFRGTGHCLNVEWMPDQEETALTREFFRHPFVPESDDEKSERCEDILSIQSDALSKRMSHTHSEKALLGLSGGLDSTLALLVTVRAFDSLGLSRKGIISVTMPCFGTTDRTRSNAEKLAAALGTSFRTVDIGEAVKVHLKDIGLSPEDRSVAYENAQARERTQVLMDIANAEGGLVVGTGDMSELALGWATYNGDHMSMYGVNAGVPKTLVRHLVRYAAETSGNAELRDVLLDILDTPVSPELLPPDKDGNIQQKTEDIIGPYELHDFFLYYFVRWGFAPSKILRIAERSFEGEYEPGTIKKWLDTFIRRFFSQQFKRSCIPDGPKVGSCALSPRGDLRMPTDASPAVWQS
ncbi:MAG: NAD(+) synthase [Lachnospiraceae bacterium]|nr:NAD(+) synthase [Lachnospiraceae bacterium]